MPLVSIVMPTLNSSRTLREAIHSLILQDYHEFELIVVDGGSIDDTLLILEKYQGDGDLKVIELEPERGIANALNIGLSEAKGEFIARMDADDVAFPSRLRCQVEFLIQNPDLGFVGSGVQNFGARGNTVIGPVTYEEIRNGFLINNPFYHSTIMLNRWMVDTGRYQYDEGQVCDEDYELWARLIPTTRCANVEQVLLRYRLHNENASWDPRKFAGKCRALQQFCDALSVQDGWLVGALAEFQCSGFMRYENYEILRRYAIQADELGWPKLGWIQQSIVQEASYFEFCMWLNQVQRHRAIFETS
jgi:glycosyltransferase involved in cell wall biosynthesis